MRDTHILLNDGRLMPRIGLGVWQIPDADTPRIVADAVAAGYRKFDGASIYGNETQLGEGLRRAALPRDEIFVTTKLWNDAQGFDAALRAFDASAKRLGLEEIDLYLIHWPVPRADLYVESWRALVRLHEEGRARSIGVSNFLPDHLARIVGETGVTPALNQIECHPYLQQEELRRVHAGMGIVTESWTPLGRSTAFGEPAIIEAARAHRKTPAQIVLRWHLDCGLVAIPRSTRTERLAENLEVFDFTLTTAEMEAIAKLDRGARQGPDPLKFP